MLLQISCIKNPFKLLQTENNVDIYTKKDFFYYETRDYDLLYEINLAM